MGYIYSLDLSMSNTGVAIFNEKGEVVHITSISTTVNKKTGLKDHPNIDNNFMTTGIKLKHIYSFLENLRKEYEPEKVIIEQGFTRFNKATQILFRVHGIVNLLFHDVENIYITPKQIKENTTGKGNAKKDAVGIAVKEIYGPIFNNDDEADALAIGYTYFKQKEQSV